MAKQHKQLTFGTSGLRDTVENMTDMECYINARGFLAYLARSGEFKRGMAVALGGDRRPSTSRIKRAVAAAIRDMGGDVDDQGLTLSPSLAYYAMMKNIPSIMVTGSHIPADRNGIKFTKKSGEVLKSDEKGILECVAEERKRVGANGCSPLLFDDNAMFREEAAREAGQLLKREDYVGDAVTGYIKRYTDVFGGARPLSGMRLFLYQHSAVGRDAVKAIFESLGAEVVAPDEKIEIEYEKEKGERIKEKVFLRSGEFVPVDTESVSNKTMAVFREMMNREKIDIGFTLDGDSDRPLLVYRVCRNGGPAEEVRYITGDILGLLAVMGLEDMGVKADAVCVPVSANDAIKKLLGEKGVELTLTKIGSPFVIDAMNRSRLAHPSSENKEWNVFSWESNGGFLTGSDLVIGGKTLKALPTRDAVLPLISVIMMSRRKGVPVSGLIDRLPRRFTHADRKKEFPVEMSKAIIAFISPSSGNELSSGAEFEVIKNKLGRVFTEERGFSDIITINYVDGVRIFFSNGEISHLRPSGNAPEFRNYAVADSLERAREIVRIGIEEIIPELERMTSVKRQA